jgi:uncharacterized protein YbjT (DUF2867 family)
MTNGTPAIDAVLIGATGLVGSHLLRQALADGRFANIVVLGRRPTGVAHDKLREHLVDFAAPERWSELVAGEVLFSALGTTLRTAGSQAAQRTVDHTYQVACASAARRNGVETFVVVSTAGASLRSPFFYSRLKAELERDVEALGFPRLRILQPGPLDGDRREHRAGERWALRLMRPLAPLLPPSARPVHAAVVARTAIAAAFDATPGTLHYAGRALAAGGGPLSQSLHRP